MSNAILKEQQLQRLRPVKPQIVHIHNRLDTLRHFDIHARVVNKNSGINKIRLALNLAASQTRQQTVRLDQSHARLRQANSISNPKRKLPADKIRIVEDRIETRSAFVGRIAVALCPQERSFEA